MSVSTTECVIAGVGSESTGCGAGCTHEDASTHEDVDVSAALDVTNFKSTACAGSRMEAHMPFSKKLKLEVHVRDTHVDDVQHAMLRALTDEVPHRPTFQAHGNDGVFYSIVVSFTLPTSGFMSLGREGCMETFITPQDDAYVQRLMESLGVAIARGAAAKHGIVPSIVMSNPEPHVVTVTITVNTATPSMFCTCEDCTTEFSETKAGFANAWSFVAIA